MHRAKLGYTFLKKPINVFLGSKFSEFSRKIAFALLWCKNIHFIFYLPTQIYFVSKIGWLVDVIVLSPLSGWLRFWINVTIVGRQRQLQSNTFLQL